MPHSPQKLVDVGNAPQPIVLRAMETELAPVGLVSSPVSYGVARNMISESRPRC
jgi:hypothetical protein